MPQVLVRFLSIRSVEEVRKSRIIATSWCVISLGCAVCIGLVGRAMMPTELLTSTDAETIFIVLAQTLLPSFMCGVVVSGIFAASMSSSSSYLIIGASAMGENIFRGLLHRKATDKAGHDCGQGHAGGHVPVRHSGGIRPELVDLPGGVLRGGPGLVPHSAR